MSDKPVIRFPPPNRAGAVLILLSGLGLLVAWSLSDKGSASPSSSHFHVQSQLDPNTAAWYELAQLPGLGEAVARRIVALRESNLAPAERPTYQSEQDLRKVKGIGPKTSKRLVAYLRFPAAAVH